jgi:hypothetical protein
VSARIYLPTTLPGLEEMFELGFIPGTVDRVVAEGDDEESEYAALMTAADASALLLDGPGRRIVVVAEPTDAEGEVPMRLVVAVHVDTEDDADPDDDLAWYATQEIPDLLAGLGRS